MRFIKRFGVRLINNIFKAALTVVVVLLCVLVIYGMGWLLAYGYKVWFFSILAVGIITVHSLIEASRK